MWMSVSLEDSASMVDLLDADRDGAISIDELRRFVYLLPEAQVPVLATRLLRVPPLPCHVPRPMHAQPPQRNSTAET